MSYDQPQMDVTLTYMFAYVEPTFIKVRQNNVEIMYVVDVSTYFQLNFKVVTTSCARGVMGTS